MTRAVDANPARGAGALLALLAFGASANAAGACGADRETPLVTPDGGDDGTSVERTACPTTEPDDGARCLLPEGTTCDFGACGTRLARCSQSVWQVASNGPPAPSCPAVPPNPAIACPACWSPAISCTYGSSDCSEADASDNTAVASCPHGSWIVDIRPCRDGGGADVQRDGGPDAD